MTSVRMVSITERLEIIVVKGENADFQRFLVFLQYFLQVSSSGFLCTGLCIEGSISYLYK